ncbi:Hypothetical protein D9617_47g010630 [Elsinoe fawcettii]|nr:Hypothetical protein D9617_47g010630 [Elsinoe fawcettii]
MYLQRHLLVFLSPVLINGIELHGPRKRFPMENISITVAQPDAFNPLALRDALESIELVPLDFPIATSMYDANREIGRLFNDMNMEDQAALFNLHQCAIRLRQHEVFGYNELLDQAYETFPRTKPLWLGTKAEETEWYFCDVTPVPPGSRPTSVPVDMAVTTSFASASPACHADSLPISTFCAELMILSSEFFKTSLASVREGSFVAWISAPPLSSYAEAWCKATKAQHCRLEVETASLIYWSYTESLRSACQDLRLETVAILHPQESESTVVVNETTYTSPYIYVTYVGIKYVSTPAAGDAVTSRLQTNAVILSVLPERASTIKNDMTIMAPRTLEPADELVTDAMSFGIFLGGGTESPGLTTLEPPSPSQGIPSQPRETAVVSPTLTTYDETDATQRVRPTISLASPNSRPPTSTSTSFPSAPANNNLGIGGLIASMIGWKPADVHLSSSESSLARSLAVCISPIDIPNSALSTQPEASASDMPTRPPAEEKIVPPFTAATREAADDQSSAPGIGGLIASMFDQPPARQSTTRLSKTSDGTNNDSAGRYRVSYATTEILEVVVSIGDRRRTILRGSDNANVLDGTTHWAGDIVVIGSQTVSFQTNGIAVLDAAISDISVDQVTTPVIHFSRPAGEYLVDTISMTMAGSDMIIQRYTDGMVSVAGSFYYIGDVVTLGDKQLILATDGVIVSGSSGITTARFSAGGSRRMTHGILAATGGMITLDGEVVTVLGKEISYGSAGLIIDGQTISLSAGAVTATLANGEVLQVGNADVVTAATATQSLTGSLTKQGALRPSKSGTAPNGTSNKGTLRTSNTTLRVDLTSIANAQPQPTSGAFERSLPVMLALVAVIIGSLAILL